MPARDDLDGVDFAVEPERAAPGYADGGKPIPLSETDPVPLFRADLRVARGGSPGLLDVTDPQRGKTFTLYEFELAVARLLDGRRAASEVVAAGARLGIPVDLRGLNQFVRQMSHYGFLAPSGAQLDPEAAPGTWSEREQWDEATRTLFQTGIRLLRSGRPGDAAGYFEAVLDAHPGNAEATEMLALIASGRPVAASPLGQLPAPAEPAPRRKGRWVAVAAAALVALGAGAAGITALRPEAPGPPPPEARLAAPKPPGTAPPAAVSSPAPPPEPPRSPWRSAPVDTRRHARVADVVAPGDGAIRWKKRANVSVRKGERLGEVRVSATGGAVPPDLARRIAELEQLAAQDPVYRDFLERARREQRRAGRGRARPVAIVAPAAGVLSLPAEAARRADEGAVLGWIVDPAVWHVGIVLDGEPPPIDAECEVLGDAPGESARCRVLDGSQIDGRRVAVTAEVLESEARWIGRAQSPYVRLAAPGTARAAP